LALLKQFEEQSGIQLNTELHQHSQRRFSLNKLYVDLV